MGMFVPTTRRLRKTAICGLRNNAPVPDRGQQIILADDAVTVPDQMKKEIEDLGRDSHQGGSPAQFATIRVERAVLE